MWEAMATKTRVFDKVEEEVHEARALAHDMRTAMG